jgi:hypothetical protein
MIISYDEFCERLRQYVENGKDFYLSLLETVIDSPARYCGLFRLSNAKTKLIQNVTQSTEIKFGDFFEDLTTEYISKLGFRNYPKDLGNNSAGDRLNVDQLFSDDNGNYYIVEQKMRDDHDSTKKRGQYENFHKKVDLVRKKLPNIHLIASMWFVDDGLVKNKNYYLGEMKADHFINTELHLYYGGEFFNSLKGGKDVWDEMLQALKKYRIDNANNNVEIPDFGSSDAIYNALIHLDTRHWIKLNSNNEKYNLLRDELFSGGDNIEKATEWRRQNRKDY